MLELHVWFSWQVSQETDFELCSMDTSSFCFAMRGDTLDEIVTFGLKNK